MAKYEIAVIAGDGIGVEVTAEAVKVLNRLQNDDLGFNFHYFEWGTDYYLKHGMMMPANGVETLKPYDAILFGAVGHPEVQDHITLNGLLLPIRRGFNQFACVRPTKLFNGIKSPLRDREDGEIDIVTIRENTEGEYSDVGGFAQRGFENEVAIQSNVFTRLGVERVARYAFEVAKTRPRKHLTSITKSNAQGYSMVMWDRIFDEVSADYPDVETASMLIDAACMQLVRNPTVFDTVVCSNLFGDIVTDLTAAITGSIGLAASGNINPGRNLPSMFEPTHGSAHDIAGQGMANPIGAVLSAAMLLAHLQERSGADRVTKAVERVIAAGDVTRDLGGVKTTAQTGNAIVNAL